MNQLLFFGLHGSAAGDCRTIRMRYKTDARGIANVLRSGWFNPVHVKSREAHAVRALLSSRKAVQRKCIDHANGIRGLGRIFGHRLPSRIDRASFDSQLRPIIKEDQVPSHALLPLLDAARYSTKPTANWHPEYTRHQPVRGRFAAAS